MSAQFTLNHNPGETYSDWTERFWLTVAGTKQLYRKEDGSLWHCAPGGLPAQIDHSLDEFQGKIHNIIEFVKVQDGVLTSTVLNRDLARLLLYSKQRQLLPVLASIVLEPAVIPDGKAGYRLTPAGYDELTGVYYHVAAGYTEIKVREGVEHLKKCFSGVPFFKEEFRNNLIAWLLGATVLDPAFGDSPFLVISGNKPNIGKSKTAEACGLILTGSSPAPIEQGGEEFEKQVSAQFLENQRFIFLDNIVSRDNSHSYHNNRLARLLTSGFSKRTRILGHSRRVTQQGVLFVGTANSCRLSSDLTERTLPIRLHKEVSSSMEPFVLHYAREHRRELYGELLWLAIQKPSIKVASDYAPTFRYKAWLEFVYPRIKEHFGNLALDEVSEMDDAVTELFGYGLDTPADFVGHDLLGVILKNQQRFPGLNERFASMSSEREKKLAFTKFLKSLLNAPHSPLPGTKITLVEKQPYSRHQAATYGFVVETTEEQA